MDPALSDPNSQAVEEATARAEAKGVRLRAMGGVAEELPFETGSFDAVVSTLVFCSVRNPSAALREVIYMVRVLVEAITSKIKDAAVALEGTLVFVVSCRNEVVTFSLHRIRK